MDRVVTSIAIAGTAIAVVTTAGLLKLAGSFRDPDPAAARAEALKVHQARLAAQRQDEARRRRWMEREFSPDAIAARNAAAAEEQSKVTMVACRIELISRLKDPSSYREHDSFTDGAGGGWIDYTATNGFGGPTRSRIYCQP
jgi:hypothetical protein